MGTARKRKSSGAAATDSENESVTSEGKRKKSKRQSIEEQRANARKWAEERKREREAKSAAVASPPPSMASIQEETGPTGTPKQISSVEIAETMAKKIKAATEAAVAKASPNKTPAKFVVETSSRQPSSKESKRAKIAADRERARKWAEEERAKKAQMESGVVSPSSSDLKSSPYANKIAEKNVRVSSKFAKVENGDAKPRAIPVVPNSSVVIETRVVEEVIELPKGPAIVEESEVAVIAMPVPKENESAKEEYFDDSHGEGGKPAKGSVTEEISSVPKSRPSFFQRVSSACGKALSFLGWFMLYFLGSMLLVYCLSVVYHDLGVTIVRVWNNEPFQNAFVPQSSSSSSTPATYCYLDDPITRAEVGHKEGHASPCASRPKKSTVPCPQNGVCFEGLFLECAPSDLFKKVENGPRKKFKRQMPARCELTDLGKQLVYELDSIVEQWTVECFCPGGSCKAGDDDSFPLMHVLNELGTHRLAQEGSDESVEVVSLPVFPDEMHLLFSHLRKSVAAKSKHVGYDMISLTPEAQSQMAVPWGCWLSRWASYLTSSFVGLMFLIASIAARQVSVYPLSTLATTLTGIGFWKVYTIRRKRERVRKVVSQAQEVAYEKLIFEAEHGRNDGYAVPILRKDVAMTLFPDVKGKQLAFEIDIWPRVVREMKSDVRIQTVQKNKGGAPMDCWIWLGNSASNQTAHRQKPVNV